MRKPHSHLLRALSFFIALIFVGIIGYSTLLQISFVDAVYMTIITISTVGYKEVAEMNAASKLFSIFIIFGGIALVGYTLTNFVEFLAGGHVQDAWRRRRMEKRIEALENHYIVCGAGETGQNVAAQFEVNGESFVMIDNRPVSPNEIGSQLMGLKLKEARIPEKTGLIVLSLRKEKSGNMIFNPGSDEPLEVGDTMIVLGNPEKTKMLMQFASEG